MNRIPDFKYFFIYSLFQEYKTCSGPYFINCDEDTLTEFHILDSAFTPICGHLASGKSQAWLFISKIVARQGNHEIYTSDLVSPPRVTINIREYRRGNPKMDNPEKLATLGTQDTERRQKTKQKTHHYTQTSTNNVNKT